MDIKIPFVVVPVSDFVKKISFEYLPGFYPVDAEAVIINNFIDQGESALVKFKRISEIEEERKGD